MTIDNNLTFTSAIFLGILIGFKHALEGDHVIAIATIKNTNNKLFNIIWVGISWGLGHSLPLLLLGSIILILKDQLLNNINNLSNFFEILVGFMLIFLGLQIIIRNIRQSNYFHTHNNKKNSIHTSHMKKERKNKNHEESHYFFNILPFIRPKSFFIGILHGLAGTGALMLVLLPNQSSFFQGITFLIFFSIGSIFSMSFISIIFFAPLRQIDSAKTMIFITNILGAVSVFLGLILLSDIIIGTNFTSFLWY